MVHPTWLPGLDLTLTRLQSYESSIPDSQAVVNRLRLDPVRWQRGWANHGQRGSDNTRSICIT